MASRRQVSPPGPRPGPAIGLLELSSIARGAVVADAAVKRAAVNLLWAKPITPGKFLVLLSGGEEEVFFALERAVDLSAATLIDRLYLPNPHPQLFAALSVAPAFGEPHSLAVVETFSVVATLLAADRALKAAEVDLLQLRMARGLGGKAYFVLSGVLHQIEAALEAAASVMHGGMLQSVEVIAHPHPDLISSLLSES
ncbi:MAG: BMC domain-containing protein [Deltaproteobacteria bacterium]|nr:BMC domain-containing protein [Deltaproteobacteria bacterium]